MKNSPPGAAAPGVRTWLVSEAQRPRRRWRVRCSPGATGEMPTNLPSREPSSRSRGWRLGRSRAGRKAEAREDRGRRLRRMDGREDLHLTAAAGALEHVERKGARRISSGQERRRGRRRRGPSSTVSTEKDRAPAREAGWFDGGGAPERSGPTTRPPRSELAVEVSGFAAVVGADGAAHVAREGVAAGTTASRALAQGPKIPCY
jgi:hypothetical protein